MFHQIGELLKKKKAFHAMVGDCGDYMASGSYHVESIFGKLALKRGRFQKNSLKGWYFRLLCGTYRIIGDETGINCNIALLSPFQNYKMFDERTRLTYTRFSEPYWENVCLFYEKMAPYFPTLIRSIDGEHHILVEKFARSEKIRDERQCFLDFCGSFLAYAEAAETTGTMTVQQVREGLAQQQLAPEVRSYAAHLESKIRDDTGVYPTIVCHNDVHIRNVLTEDNASFRLIDFELCGSNVFFFDVLGFIFNSAVFFKDKTLFGCYLAGELDEQLRRCFSSFGVDYQKERKIEYYYLYSYFRLYMMTQIRPVFPPSYLERCWKFEDDLLAHTQENF
jgi:hypothetical protein